MNDTDTVKRLLAIGMGLGLAMGGPYSEFSMRIPKGKPQRGHLVGCHICGATRGTLYKDGDQRICGECRKKKEVENCGEG